MVILVTPGCTNSDQFWSYSGTNSDQFGHTRVPILISLVTPGCTNSSHFGYTVLGYQCRLSWFVLGYTRAYRSPRFGLRHSRVCTYLLGTARVHTSMKSHRFAQPSLTTVSIVGVSNGRDVRDLFCQKKCYPTKGL